MNLYSWIGISLQHRYKLYDQIRVCGFSSVYLARGEQSEKIVAVAARKERKISTGVESQEPGKWDKRSATNGTVSSAVDKGI